MAVIIEPAHQSRIDDVLDTDSIEVPADTVEMRARLLIEIIGQQRRTGNDVLQLGILAVENAQRIAFEAPQTVCIQFRFAG